VSEIERPPRGSKKEGKDLTPSPEEVQSKSVGKCTAATKNVRHFKFKMRTRGTADTDESERWFHMSTGQISMPHDM
jgi:hypothetical protein